MQLPILTSYCAYVLVTTGTMQYSPRSASIECPTHYIRGPKQQAAAKLVDP